MHIQTKTYASITMVYSIKNVVFSLYFYSILHLYMKFSFATEESQWNSENKTKKGHYAHTFSARIKFTKPKKNANKKIKRTETHIKSVQRMLSKRSIIYYEAILNGIYINEHPSSPEGCRKDANEKINW